MARTVSPLNFVYKWKVGVGLTAALQEEIDVYGDDHDFLYLASRVPSVQLMFVTPGEAECAIAARDEAVSAAEAEMVGVVAVTEKPVWLRL